MLEITKKIKDLRAKKKIIEQKINSSNDPENLELKITLGKTNYVLTLMEKERAEKLAEHRKAYSIEKRKDEAYMNEKRKKENRGRERRYYFVKTDKGERKIKNLTELLATYSQMPNAHYYAIIRYSGNKIKDGVTERVQFLKPEDILMLE